uniref:NADH-ubiquinone oxidoreductase chain 4 n=1 Tax=Callosobruchus chinensis TaxID=146774 RepID=A0A1P8YZI5_CALCS|nr:NADH dehydrogenase subunit 4 [Callosobruchus chinensis]AST14948.1 NADH dehydrogenase subunit 4 [Callosobruchus chinensis]ATL15418.1 NADH dehydrogenase subunit 4 [Callosobruchus chinensis]
MMKFMFSLLFLIPVCFIYNYWLMVNLFFILSFMFMMNFSFNYMYMNISYLFGSDLLSYIFILLSFWICSLMLLASEKIYKLNDYYYLFNFMVLLLLISLYLVFSSLNLFIFYLFFEVSLIPTFILIMGWGYQPERIEAGIYLLFYTLLVSLPMMISIFYCYNFLCTMMLMFLDYQFNLFMYFCMNMVFFVKMPMFFIHLWLPKAHVEAPISGSMILAGVMLKLGGYGLFRLLSMFILSGLMINYIFIIISLVGGFFVSLICIYQSDMKSLVAYSSVAHMGLVLAGIMTMSIWGVWGALVMMLAHGLCSSGLFCLVNMVYERAHSRSLYMNKGLINIMPSLSFWWFMLCSSNMAAPPSLNLLGEIILLSSLVFYSKLLMILLVFLSFFSAVYSLYLFSYSQHGGFYSGFYSVFQGFYREYLLLLLHWLPLNLMIIKSELWVLWI